MATRSKYQLTFEFMVEVYKVWARRPNTHVLSWYSSFHAFARYVRILEMRSAWKFWRRKTKVAKARFGPLAEELRMFVCMELVRAYPLAASYPWSMPFVYCLRWIHPFSCCLAKPGPSLAHSTEWKHLSFLSPLGWSHHHHWLYS